VIHAPLQARRDEPEVRRRMDALATLARDATSALQVGDVDEVGRCMDAGFEHRRVLFALDPPAVEIVEGLRELGAAATYTGSGGAVVALARDNGRLRDWAATHDLDTVTTLLEPP
jgi:glucuronokinase